MTHLLRAAGFVFLLVLASCAPTRPPLSGLEAYRGYDRPASLPDDPRAVVVKVSTSRQRVYVMEGSRPLLVMPVSVGDADSPTPHGSFRILRKDDRRRSTVQGFARTREGWVRTPLRESPAGARFVGTPLPYWCEFRSGRPPLAFHTGWIKHRPCTDGSIRLHENLAPKFFRLVRVGTPVVIAAWQPEDATLGNIPLPPDAGPLPDDPAEFYLGDAYFTRHVAPEFR